MQVIKFNFYTASSLSELRAMYNNCVVVAIGLGPDESSLTDHALEQGGELTPPIAFY